MSAARPTPNDGIMKIAAYVPGKSSGPQGVKLHKLSSNETPLGPSPEARRAYAEIAEHLEDYPDGSASSLRAAVSWATCSLTVSKSCSKSPNAAT